MKLAVRVLAAAAVVALATPALACGEMKQTTTASTQTTQTKQAQPVAKGEKKAAKPAKSEQAAKKTQAQTAQN
jgi:hypothetical protein